MGGIMEIITVMVIIFAFCIALYYFGNKISKKSKSNREVFAAGKQLPTIRPKYFSQLYLAVLFFLIFDSMVLIIATGNIFNEYTKYFLGIILFFSILIGLEVKKNL